ncbi:ATP-binding protein [Dactylosporangium salmoneum]|uniref:Helicase HerA central domain-containing protein n=1 Tax=Dactylosporangium salmoneum TaxID=53361 RepID=A0ABP5UE34_9ACTN
MTTALPPRLVEVVAERLHRQLTGVADGHCVRVDDLAVADAEAIAERLCAASPPYDAYVLALGTPRGTREVPVDRAIELRNRKVRPLLLLVPAGADRAASSLDNSFQPLPLVRLLASAGDDLEHQLIGNPVYAGVRELKRALGKSRGTEAWARFLDTLLSEPTWPVFGRQLWQVGLIPDHDGTPDIQHRLRANAKAVTALVRPVRAASLIADRLHAAGVRDADDSPTRQRLLAFLTGEAGVLTNAATWTRALGERHGGALTFECWPIAEPQQAALNEVTLTPFMRDNGTVDPTCKLRVDEDGQLYCDVSADRPGSIVVRWSTDPVKPASVGSWRIDVLPPEDLREPDTTPVVAKKVAGDKRRATITLALDEDDLEAGYLFVVRLRAQDSEGNDLRLADGRPAEAESDAFVVMLQDQSPERGIRKISGSSVPELVLRAAAKGGTSLAEEGAAWDLAGQVFSVRIGRRETSLMRVSRVLVELQRRLFVEPAAHAFRAHTELGVPVEAAQAEPVTLGLPPAFLERRRRLLAALARRAPRDVAEAVLWDDELREQATGLLHSYRRALDTADPAARLALLTVDTVSVRVRTAVEEVDGVVLLPLHPLRLVWLASHDAVLRGWAAELVEGGLPATRRGASVDLPLVALVSPANVPFTVLSDDGRAFLYAEELTHGAALYLPVGVQEPEAMLDVLCASLDIGRDNASLRAASALIGLRVNAYRLAHPGTDALRVMAVNPGSGMIGRRALEALFREPADEEPVDTTAQALQATAPPRLEVVAYTDSSSFTNPVPELRQLQTLATTHQLANATNYLVPPVGLATRPLAELAGDRYGYHIAIVQDPVRGSLVESADDARTPRTTTFHDLLTPLLTVRKVERDGYEWHAQPALRSRGGAPASDVVEAHRAHQLALAAHLGMTRAPVLSLRLTHDDLRMLDTAHTRADWVVTLDGYLGYQLYEDPTEVGVGEHNYLLDYAPDFLDGFGSQVTVSTAHRGEVQHVLHEAMERIGFAAFDYSIAAVLQHLLLVSGRLALRLLANTTLATEAVSLAALMLHLERRGDLEDRIIIPVDVHPELFAGQQRRDEAAGRRCDLLLVRVTQRSLKIECVEVKSRREAALPAALADRIVDQLVDTRDLLIQRFFAIDPGRVDTDLQRTRLAGLLHYYARRSAAYQLVAPEKVDDLHRNIDRVCEQRERPEITMRGYVVSLEGSAGFKPRHRDVPIVVLTAADLGQVGLTSIVAHSESGPAEKALGRHRSAEPPAAAKAPPVTVPPSPSSVVTASHMHSAAPSEPAPPLHSALLCEPAPPTQPIRRPDQNGALHVELGRDQAGAAVGWELSTRGSPHGFILGIPGQGKSVTTRGLMRQLAAHGLPSLVLDFHGDLAARAPAGTTVVDAAVGLPFSPFELVTDDDRLVNQSAWEVSEIVAYVCGLGEIQRNNVYRGIQAAYHTALQDGPRVPTMEEFADAVADAEEGARGRNARDRIRALTDFGLFRPVPGASFDPTAGPGMVIDVSRLGLETVQVAAGAFLLRKLYRDMFGWKQDGSMKIAIVLDEAHRLAKDVTLPKLMKEGRKYGVAVIMASQGMSDFHRDVLGNAGTKIVFRTNFPASKYVAGFLRGRGDQDLSREIEQLDVGVAYVSTPDHVQARRVYMHPESE